jgi:5'-nucleotidase (lipoprotein e(P4) family)
MMKKLAALLMVFTLSFSFNSMNGKAQNTADSTARLQEQNTMSVLWFQKAGEAKALYYQGYNIGKMRLDQLLAKKPKKKGLKPAVVLDIDETILDNSPYQAWNVVTGKAYPLSWNEWIASAGGKALPGAVEFLKYADSKGVAIFYISNRKEAQKDATIKNLQSVGAPQADAAHVLLLQPNEKGKEMRRQQVSKTHDILLLFGDNLGDFSGFDNLSIPDRLRAVDNRKEEFGRKLIVFPNPMYGDWEGAVYNYDYSKSDMEKASLRKEQLQPYQP